MNGYYSIRRIEKSNNRIVGSATGGCEYTRTHDARLPCIHINPGLCSAVRRSTVDSRIGQFNLIFRSLSPFRRAPVPRSPPKRRLRRDPRVVVNCRSTPLPRRVRLIALELTAPLRAFEGRPSIFGGDIGAYGLPSAIVIFKTLRPRLFEVYFLFAQFSLTGPCHWRSGHAFALKRFLPTTNPRLKFRKLVHLISF